MKIVDYKKDDILIILREFRNSFYNSSISDEQLISLSNKFMQFAIFRVLKEKDENFGFYSLYANDIRKKKAFLSMIVVKKSKQGFGYGKKLMLDCIEQSKLNNMDRLQLEVNKTNKKGIAFYNKYGFKIINENDTSLFLEMEL